MERLFFKTPQMDDYLNVKSIWEDPDTMEAVGGIFPISEDKYVDWLDFMTNRGKHKNCYYLIMMNKKCVGEVSFHRFNHENKTANLNIKIKSAYRRKGIGKKALDFIFDEFFNKWDGEEIIDNIREGNTAGLHALKSYGLLEKKNKNNETILFLSKENYKSISSV